MDSDASSYWASLCEIRSRLKCWVRLAWTPDGRPTEVSRWGMLLGIPVPGYLEGPAGPVRMGEVEWVELSTSRLKGCMVDGKSQVAGTRDIREALVSELTATGLVWERHDATWSMAGKFDDLPVQTIRVSAPNRPRPVAP